jgi:hypothetical protein
MKYSEVRGFNYQPSYGSTSFENWLNFDSEIIELELRRGKEFFPVMNTVRLWLSWAAFVRNPQKFIDDFEKSLEICDQLELKVMPVLFNRWHNEFLDCGGIYIDHFMEGWSWLTREDQFSEYINDLVGAHIQDDRILAWDICNEPFTYDKPIEEMKEIEKNEYLWLESIYKRVKAVDSEAAVGVSLHAGHKKEGLERVLPISDLLLIHPYFMAEQDDQKAKEEFYNLLDDYVEISKKADKPLLVTETCWGSLDDQWRVENMKFTLKELKKRNIGWLAHALHYSLVADLHYSEDGPVGPPGNLAFIEKDGSLREGHGVFNEF